MENSCIDNQIDDNWDDDNASDDYDKLNVHRLSEQSSVHSVVWEELMSLLNITVSRLFIGLLSVFAASFFRLI